MVGDLEMTEKLDKYIMDVDYDCETGEEHCTVLKTDGTTHMLNWIEIVSVMYTHHSVFEPLIKELNNLSNENEQLRKDSTVLILANQDYRKENEQLKKALVELKEIGDYQYGRIKELSDENEELKEEIKDYNDVLARIEEQNEQLKKENKRLDDLWGEKCVKEHMQFLGETALKEMHDEKYGGKDD